MKVSVNQCKYEYKTGSFPKPITEKCERKVSFSAKPPVCVNPMWDDFCRKLAKSYPNQKINDVIVKCFQDCANKLGEGRDKLVFSIPEIKDYVCAFLKKAPIENLGEGFVAIEDNLPKYYFGQPIGGNGKFIVMKKISGKEHSIHNWAEKYEAFQLRKEPVSKQDAELFLQQIKEIDSLPTESFVDLQKQVRYLTDNNIRIDSINPNNIMIDKETGRMQILDLSRQSPKFAVLKPEINCAQDATNLLTDSLLNTEYLDILDHNDSVELMNTTKKVISKSRDAGKTVGLSEDLKSAEQFYEIIQKHRAENGSKSLLFHDSYKAFLRKYHELFNY